MEFSPSFHAGLSPNIGALKSQVSFATDALSQLSSQILSQYSQPGSLDALNDTLAFAVKQGIPAAGGLQSFIDSKLK